MTFINGDIPLSANFQVNVAKPIDSRLVVSTFSDLSSVDFAYAGCLTYVLDEEKFYKYDGTTWIEFTSGGGSYIFENGLTEGTSGVVDLGGFLNKETFLFGNRINIGTSEDGTVYDSDVYIDSYGNDNVNESYTQLSAHNFDGQTDTGTFSNISLTSGSSIYQPTVSFNVSKDFNATYNQFYINDLIWSLGNSSENFIFSENDNAGSRNIYMRTSESNYYNLSSTTTTNGFSYTSVSPDSQFITQIEGYSYDADRAFLNFKVFDNDDSTNDRKINLETGTAILISGQDARYSANYSSIFVNRSLVDKEYVDNLFGSAGGSSYTFTNGLTLDTTNVKLGGELTESTYIFGAQDIFIGQDQTSVNAGDVYISAKAKADGQSATLQMAAYSYNSAYITGFGMITGDEATNYPQFTMLAQTELLNSSIQLGANRIELFNATLDGGNGGASIKLSQNDTFFYNQSSGTVYIGYSPDFNIMPNGLNIASKEGGIQIVSTTPSLNHNSNLIFSADDSTNGATVLFNAINNITTDNSSFKATAESLKFSTHSISSDTWFNLDANIITSTHIKYDQNYSSVFTSRSLVDKAYVDNLVTGSTSGVSFIPLTGTNEITGNLYADMSLFNFGLKGASNYIQMYDNEFASGIGIRSYNLAQQFFMYTDLDLVKNYIEIGSPDKQYKTETGQPHSFTGDYVSLDNSSDYHSDIDADDEALIPKSWFDSKINSGANLLNFNGVTDTFTFSHNFDSNPTSLSITFSDDSMITSGKTITKDGTTITITFDTPPLTGSTTVYWQVFR